MLIVKCTLASSLIFLVFSPQMLLKDSEGLIPLPISKPWGSQRPESPLSVLGLVTSTPTVAHAVKLTGDAFERALRNPLSNIPDHIARMQIVMPASQTMALHMRVGADRLDYDALNNDHNEGETPKSFFFPKARASELDEVVNCFHCRQWSVVATSQVNVIQLHAIPLGWKSSDNAVQQDMALKGSGLTIPFYLTAKLILPHGSRIRDIGFYSDDGKSSLSSGNDSGTGKEGHQKLGVLVEKESQVDLWLIFYDDIQWQSLLFHGELLTASDVHEFATFEVHAMEDSMVEDRAGLLAQSKYKLPMSVLSKPRGGQTIALIPIFFLQHDESRRLKGQTRK